MIGLFITEAILFVVAGVAGFAIGWRVQASDVAEQMRRIRNDSDALRAALTDAQVRRAARGS